MYRDVQLRKIEPSSARVFFPRFNFFDSLFGPGHLCRRQTGIGRAARQGAAPVPVFPWYSNIAYLAYLAGIGRTPFAGRHDPALAAGARLSSERPMTRRPAFSEPRVLFGPPYVRRQRYREFSERSGPASRSGGLRRLTASEQSIVNRLLARLPYYRSAIQILAGRDLGEKGRRLIVGAGESGSRMHAASFLRLGRIVIDEELLKQPRELARILYHEIFHFVWARLGNPTRLSYENMLRREIALGARGELGWPSEAKKLALRQRAVAARCAGRLDRNRLWPEYVCESFCDSAAWFCLPSWRRHREWTLKPRFREQRRRWFQMADVLPRLQL